MKVGMYEYIMAPEPILTEYFINPSHKYACLYVYPPVFCAAHVFPEKAAEQFFPEFLAVHFVKRKLTSAAVLCM
jgi:hypothetical protein